MFLEKKPKGLYKRMLEEKDDLKKKNLEEEGKA